MFTETPANLDSILYTLLGVLATNFTKVNQYFFGSSKSSSDKTKLLTGG